MKRTQTESIEDCVEHLNVIAFKFETECNNFPSVFQIFDSNIFYYVARLYAMLQEANPVEVGKDIYASLDYCKQREMFDDVIVIINESLTNAYRKAGAIVDFKDINVLEETTLLSIPDNIGVLNANELYDKIRNVQNMTAETYREVHKYISAALVEIEECLFPSHDRFKVYDQFKEGYKKFAEEEGKEETCRLERLASHFKIHMTDELSAEHWEKLYKLDLYAFSCANRCVLVEKDKRLEGEELKRALAEELSDNSSYLIDEKWNDIFPYSYRKDLQDNRRILENIKQRAKTGQLVFPEVIDMDDFFERVDSKNLDFFYRIMFRINLELSRIFSRLDKEYCERMDITPAQPEDSHNIEDLPEEAKISDKGVDHKLCIALNRTQREILDAAETKGIIMYNSSRKGYDTGHQSSNALVAYLCGRLFCGDSTNKDGHWVSGSKFNDAKYCKELFGFDVAGTRRSTQGNGAGKSPIGYDRVDKLFE